MLKSVLDHGFVRLVDTMGDDTSVVRAARVSYDAHWRAGDDKNSDRRLLKYLWKNKHSTPFEAVTFTFEVKAPVFVFRQWHRHRTWSYNELSARYKELPEEYYIPDAQIIGVQSQDNKQGRDRSIMNDNYVHIQQTMSDHSSHCFVVYRKLLELNTPRELARMVLPLNSYSHMFATVDLLNLLKFLTLRDHEHAQWEIAEFARAMKELAREIVPVTMEIFDAERG